MDQDEDVLVFDVTFKTEAFINEPGRIAIRQHNNINEIAGNQYDFQDVLIEIPLHHLDEFVIHLKRIRDEYVAAINANEE